MSYNKFLAKLASDHNKPDGLCVVTPAQGEAFVAALPVARFHGVGPVTAARMARLGIETGADLRAQSLPFLQAEFGKSGPYYYWAARGRDDRPVRPDRIRKSIGAETTFSADLTEEADLMVKVDEMAQRVADHAGRSDMRGRTVTLKVKFSDFRIITRARSFAQPVGDHAALTAAGADLLHPLCPVPRGVRLVGLSLSGFDGSEAPRDAQLGLGL